ncbi:MAG: DUF3108 domain-containing protein [Bacteroidales bacterium]|jgi:hypothetical protein|nr:DUF3108 domain-containing protein [Bacteroidales bacterium]
MHIAFLIPLFLISFLPSETQKDYLEEPAFQSGEILTYKIRYGIITGGQVKISANETTLNNKSVYHAVLEGKTTGLIDKIYKVHDIYESYFNLENNLPDKAVRNIREGSYRYYDEVMYNHDSLYVESQRNGRVSVPKNTLDMASVAFYVRRLNLNALKPDDIIHLDTYFGDSLFPFYIVYKGKETISVSAGKFKCFKFVPIVEPGRVFESNDDMTIWFSDDMNKIPISIKFDIIVGSFRCDLTKFENLKYPLTSKVK